MTADRRRPFADRPARALPCASAPAAASPADPARPHRERAARTTDVRGPAPGAGTAADRASAGRGLRALGRRLAVAGAVALGLGAATLGAPAPAAAQNQAQPRLPMVELTAGIHLIRAEVADSFDTRMRGLMFRDRLGPNEGMLFVFQDRSEQCFWMKNTILPLSIAFIDDDGTIANIADMKPLDETSHCSARPVRFALEMEQGWFAKRGIKAGTKMGGDKVFRAAR